MCINNKRLSFGNSFKIGDRISIDGITYQIENVKQGGMAFVLILKRVTESSSFGYEVIFKSKIAVKTLKRALLEGLGPELFRRELNIWVTLEHPNIVPLRLVTKYKDDFVAIMPFYRGTLRDMLCLNKPMKQEIIINIIKQVIKGLNYAFCSFKLLHLDIKPENILSDLSSNNRYLISDWGIASLQQTYYSSISNAIHEDGLFSLTFGNFGTLPYMSPERLLEKHSNIQFDIYSVGILLYELLIGEPPFERHSGKPLYAQILSGDYYNIAKRTLTGTPNGYLNSIILNCITPDLRNRYEDYSSLDSDLSRVNSRVLKLFNIFVK
jgi:serine/threonine protein kinase